MNIFSGFPEEFKGKFRESYSHHGQSLELLCSVQLFQIPVRIDQNQVRAGASSWAESVLLDRSLLAVFLNERRDMDGESQDFYEELSGCSRTGFRTKFSRVARRLGLSQGLNRSEMSRLYEAAFLAALCNISFNGLGGCGGEIRPENELTRCRLEQSFMDACDNFFSSPGWKALSASRKKSIRSVFLSVVVADENLAH